MAIAFRRLTSAPLVDFEAAAPDGVVVGIIGENGAGKSRLLRVAAGVEAPVSGVVERSGPAKLIGPADALDPAPVLLLDDAFASKDLLARERAAVVLDRLRRAGGTVLLVSHEEQLLRRLADEVWWLDRGRLAGRGDPEVILAAYRGHIAGRLREWGEGARQPVDPRVRRGDGRAEILRIDTLGENGTPTILWRSGELAVIRVCVRYREAVADPVIGIMIRTRLGLNVYGTNTELEQVKLGPCAAGENLEVRFAFRCELCPQDYTITAASHDPDGTQHEWLEDALAVSVIDSRYTAGVANLRAQVTLWSRG
jgi:lipopolysaccharide transport system ATP-binding protein